MGGPTVEFSCRERTARDHVQKGTISRAKRSAGTICSAAVDSNGLSCWLPLWLMTVDIGEAVFLCHGTGAVDSTSFRDDLRVTR